MTNNKEFQIENLIIQETNVSPAINFNANTGEFTITGKSYPENTFEFYTPVNDWLDQYFEETKNELTMIDIKLDYLSSSSLKAFFDMFDIFEGAREDGKFIKIKWLHSHDDDIMEEIGEDFKEDFETLNFNLVIIE